MSAAGSLTSPGNLRGSSAQAPRPAWGRGRPGASPEAPTAAAKSWALSAAGRLGGRGEALTAGKGTEPVPARGALPWAVGRAPGTRLRHLQPEELRGWGTGSLLSPWKEGLRSCASVSLAVSGGPVSLQTCRLDHSACKSTVRRTRGGTFKIGPNEWAVSRIAS